VLQLPLGRALDRHGPRRTLLALLAVAVLGCVAFAQAGSLWGLIAARALIGAGVAACLMAPLTSYRHLFTPSAQLRANSWMLMTGSLGMVAATLPVQWLLPVLGWRGLFWVLAVLIVLAMLGLAWRVPTWSRAAPPDADQTPVGYGQIARHRYFRQMLGIGFINYGGMIAIQTLWAGPWMVKVAGYSAEQAAQGLFGINVCMLLTFWLWGVFNPRLARRGWSAERLIARGMLLPLLLLALIVWLGPRAGWPLWAAFCVASSFGALAQPAVGMALPAQAAGRALSAYNLVIFAGVFAMQWSIGLLIDAFGRLGWDTVASFRGAMGVFGLCGLWAYVVFLRGHHRATSVTRG
jgi:predicted MFS family arabinose efflux permease